MSDTINYKGFVGSVHYSAEDDLFHGTVEGIDDTVSFEGKSVAELKKDFRIALDDYLSVCKRLGKNPRKSYKGSFNIRISPELHKHAAEQAVLRRISLNEFVQEAIKNKVFRS
jgi:predicted HicB family RNase H-like nuclease